MLLEEAIMLPVIIGLVEVVKRVGLSSKWSPIAAILISIGFGLLGTYVSTFDLIVEGIITGLTAVGLYSGARATLKTK
jgi:hypothetical protein